MKSSLTDYAIPETFDMECKLLASILNDSSLISVTMQAIKREMFSNDENAKIWEVIMNMYSNHEGISMMTVLPKVNNRHFKDNIVTAEPEWSEMRFESLLRAFLDMYVKRCAYFRAVDILQKVNAGIDCSDITKDFDTFKADVLKGFYDDSAKTTSDLANELADKIQSGVNTRVPTGIRTLDQLTYGGFHGGSLVILAARPSVGKTTIALQIALHASTIGNRSLFFSLEMTSEELIQRLVLSTGDITPSDFYTRNFIWEDYENAVRKVTNNYLLINDKAVSVDDICQRIKVDVQTNQCKLAVIDYLGLIPINSRENTATAIAGVTRKIKNTAKECNIPIILLCQLNRASANDNRSPQLHDLRDSGAIEQDADIVIMLEKGKNELGALVENTIDLWIRKNRAGKCNYDGATKLYGNETYSQFSEQ